MVKQKSIVLILCFAMIVVVFYADIARSRELDTVGIEGRSEDSYSPLPKGYAGRWGKSSETDEEESSELFVRTITLKFLDAQNLRAAIGKMVSEHGSISIDKKSNSLIVCDTKGNLEKIVRQIKEADQTPEQVMVEVVIIDVLLNDEYEVGVNWNNLFNRKHNPKYNQTLLAPGLLGGTFSIVSGSIDGAIHALQASRDVEILASPRVLVVSGQSARIQAITEIPYQEITQTGRGGGNGLVGVGDNVVTSTVFKEVGIVLNVKATVTDEQKILLVIEPSQSVDTEEDGANGVPIIDTRTASTTLLMEDDQILVMGGMRRKDTKLIDRKVPFFGDLPWIGPLFRSSEDVTNYSELVVMISPHIYNGEFIDDNTMEKYEEITESSLLSLRRDKNTNKELQGILNRLERNLTKELRSMAKSLGDNSD